MGATGKGRIMYSLGQGIGSLLKKNECICFFCTLPWPKRSHPPRLFLLLYWIDIALTVCRELYNIGNTLQCSSQQNGKRGPAGERLSVKRLCEETQEDKPHISLWSCIVQAWPEETGLVIQDVTKHRRATSTWSLQIYSCGVGSVKSGELGKKNKCAFSLKCISTFVVRFEKTPLCVCVPSMTWNKSINPLHIIPLIQKAQWVLKITTDGAVTIQ